MTSADISYDDTADVYAERTGMRLADCFVVVAMGLVAAALAVGMIAQLSIDPPVALGAAAAGFAALLAGHIALRRSNSPRRVPAGVRDRRPMPQPAVVPRPTPEATPAAKTPSPADDPDALEKFDLGNFRPRSPGELPAKPAPAAAEDADPGDDIEDMIRRLANDIEAGRKTLKKKDAAAKPAAKASVSAKRKEPTLPAAKPSQPPKKPAAAPPPVPAAKAAKKPLPPTMKQAATPPAMPTTQPPSPVTATAKLAAIADALSDEQLEVCLQTINDLEDYRARHYEVSVRLHVAGGDVLDNRAYVAETRGTGLLPLIEAVKVSSAKRVAVQLIRRGRSGDFFSTVDGEALSDRQFSDDVDTITGRDPVLASRLVLAFSQNDVRNLSQIQLTTLESIAALGFRFSIEDISDLDMDFEELARLGFAFAKLDAEVFLSGLPTGTTRVPSADICRHLAKAGLALIVGKIDDETARAKILGFGAVLGQGALFGAPRPVRSDVLRPGSEPRQPAT